MKQIILIEKEEFQNLIARLIMSKEYKDILKNMAYSNIEFEQGFIQGLCWSTLYTTQCKSYYLEVEDEDKVSE